MDATNLYIRRINTKPYEGAEAVETELTLDCSALSQRDFIEYALRSLVISWQSTARRNALKKENAVPIPAKATVVVEKPGVRKQMDMDSLIAKLSPAQKQALIEKLMGTVQEPEQEQEQEQEQEPVQEQEPEQE